MSGKIIDNDFINSNYLLREYRNIMFNYMKNIFSDISKEDILSIINDRISETFVNPNVSLYNSYKDKTANSTLLDFGNFVEKNEPILTSSGVIFQNHSKNIESVLPSRFKHYISERDKLKGIMFQFKEGTYEYELYDILQLLAKIDGNALYGMIGLSCSLLFNNDIASSITLTGRGLISIAGVQIEMFLNNNVKFDNINDILNLFNEIDNHSKVKNSTFFESNNIKIDIDKCFNRIMETCQNNISGWLPSDNDKHFVYNHLSTLTQDKLNILYYKNNLFEFLEIPSVKQIICDIYTTLDSPYINPYKPPEEIKPQLDYLYSLIYDFVYYKNIINNSILKYSNMTRSVNIITDTDSCIICFNRVYELLCDIVKNVKMKYNAVYIDYSKYVEGELRGFSKYNFPKRYNFIEDKVEDNEEFNNNKKQLITFNNDDGHRFSLLNIISFIMGNIINDYVERYVSNCNALMNNEDKQCIMVLKNEFLMKNILLTDAKKLYASIIELREGTISNNKLDIKGLQIGKSTSNKRIRDDLQNLLYHLILNPDTVNCKEVIEQMAILKVTLKNSLKSKEKDYYNPLKIKSIKSYDDPYRTRGVKGMILWNIIKDEGQIAFNLNEVNYVDNVKISINPEVMKEKYPEKYQKLYDYLLEDNNFTKGNKIDKVISEITSLSVPKEEEIPDAMLEFIDYNTVIDDNLSKLPIECIGIHKKEYTPYTNIVQL